MAGRLAEKHHRPVVLISWDPMGVKPGVGSARSVPGFNLYAALEACSQHLLGHGGHAAAAGLRIEEDKLDAFRADLEAVKALVMDPTSNLLTEIPHAPGYTILREILLVADHNAYHIGEFAILRQVMGTWPAIVFGPESFTF